MEVTCKFFKVKSFGDDTFFVDSVIPSIDLAIRELEGILAKELYCSHFDEDGVKIEEPNVNYENVFCEAFDLAFGGNNIITPSIPKMIFNGIVSDDIKEYELIDITDEIVKKFFEKVDIKEIEEFILTHNEDEIAERYCADRRHIEQYWW